MAELLQLTKRSKQGHVGDYIDPCQRCGCHFAYRKFLFFACQNYRVRNVTRPAIVPAAVSAPGSAKLFTYRMHAKGDLYGYGTEPQTFHRLDGW